MTDIFKVLFSLPSPDVIPPHRWLDNLPAHFGETGASGSGGYHGQILSGEHPSLSQLLSDLVMKVT